MAEKLRLGGQRVTKSRRRVLRALAESDDHFTIDGLARRLPAVGRATVFRTVKLLLEQGLLCRVLLEDGSVRYRLSRREAHHHHLICVECGDVQDFVECDLGPLSLELSRRTDYEINGHRLEMYGRCPACQAAEGAAPGSDG
ncbi:MAG: Fur family transcriptional regulator [Dehalococcoidia bacterium]|nr:Fur family transcriptional regulator [Dehalococcoidia bacterium]